jgi:hypothetical protein
VGRSDPDERVVAGAALILSLVTKFAAAAEDDGCHTVADEQHPMMTCKLVYLNKSVKHIASYTLDTSEGTNKSVECFFLHVLNKSHGESDIIKLRWSIPLRDTKM